MHKNVSRYFVCVLLRLFKSFAAQPRLGVVTDTILHASRDMFPLLIVFGCVFLTASCIGVVIFGKEVVNFSELSLALTSCWRLVLGDFDWAVLMQKSNFRMVVLFNVSFNLLIVLILMNMLLAIVLDTYMKVNDSARNSEHLWTQAWEIFRRWNERRLGNSVSLGVIRYCLLEDAEERLRDDEAMLGSARDAVTSSRKSGFLGTYSKGIFGMYRSVLVSSKLLISAVGFLPP